MSKINGQPKIFIDLPEEEECAHSWYDVIPVIGKPWVGTCRACGEKVKLVAVQCDEEIL